MYFIGTEVKNEKNEESQKDKNKKSCHIGFALRSDNDSHAGCVFACD